MPELEAALPKALANQAEWKLSASHNPEAAANATGTTPGGDGIPAAWRSRPGMWFQIELPQPARVTEVQIDTALPFSFGGRGRAGGGRGAPGAGGAPRRAARLRPAPGAAARRCRSPVRSPTRCRCRWTEATGALRSAQGAGSAPTTVIAFTPVQAKFVRITQTGTAAANEQWAIAQVRVFTK